MDSVLLLKSIIMGVIEGITEFLPISSTGYLILSADVLDFWDKDRRALFIVFVQLGAILAVVYNYWGRLWQAFLGLITGQSAVFARPRQLGMSLIIATVPVMVLGLLLADYIAVLFHPVLVAVMLIVGALLIIYVEKTLRPIIATKAEAVNIKTALAIGLCQCLALLPGTSRSGATIIGAVFFGVEKKAAAEFSFFLGIPVIVGASLLDLLKYRQLLTNSSDWAVLLLGTAVAFLVALACIRWLVAWLANKDLLIFAWLRIATGVLVLLMYFVFGYQMAG